MKVIYDSLKQRLLDTTHIQDVRRYNNQVQQLETGSVDLYLPSVLIEFTEVTYGHQDKIKQHGSSLVKFHIVTEDYNGEPEVYADLWEDVTNTLIHYSDKYNYHPLIRVGEEHDTNFTNIYVYTIIFKMDFVHYLKQETTEGIYLGLEIKANDKYISITPPYSPE